MLQWLASATSRTGTGTAASDAPAGSWPARSTVPSSFAIAWASFTARPYGAAAFCTAYVSNIAPARAHDNPPRASGSRRAGCHVHTGQRSMFSPREVRHSRSRCAASSAERGVTPITIPPLLTSDS